MNTNLVFICGFPSSGTDLLKNIMNAHSDISISGEFPFLPKIANNYSSKIPASEIIKLIAELKKIDVYNNFGNSSFDVSQLGKKPEYLLSDIYASMLNNNTITWKGNKTPQNTENLDKLKILFPDAKFILIVRDVRDICLSAQKKWGKDKNLWAAKWNERMLKGYELLNNLNQNEVLIIKYESLLKNLYYELQRICSFLNLKYQSSMLDYHLNVKDIIEGKLNYGKPLIENNTQKWQKELSKKDIKRIEEIAFFSLQTFDYKISKAIDNKPITYLEKLYGLLHDSYSLLLVGNRAKGKSNSISDRLKSIIFEFKKRFA